MRRVCFVLLTIFIVMETFSQSRSSDRQPVAAGRFYSADKETLMNDVSELFKSCVKSSSGSGIARAVISPHAGYVFSGKVAASAYTATGRNTQYKNIFIIGSSHVMAFEGASVYGNGDFVTPLGRVTVNKEIANKLKAEKLFSFPVSAHLQEHSLEVQLPLIQYYFKNNPQIVPIIIATNNANNIRKIADILKPWFTPENLFVISSDFSHYPSYKTANEVDNATAESIVSGDPEKFLDVLEKNSRADHPGLSTSMCGWTSGLLLLYLAEGTGLQFKKIDYCNSGDSRYGSKDEVVGYHAIALFGKNSASSASGNLAEKITFTGKEKDQLISIARDNIKSLLYNRKKVAVNPELLPAVFREPLGAFVTLKINDALRGCIGRFISSDPLYEVVIESSASSAFEDPRFSPLTKDELAKTDIEITVLGPMKKISSISEIVLGRHGIYIKKDSRSGTMLPQVATENNWTVEQFLGYTSRDKAGIGWDGWKDAEIYIYEGIVLEETKK